MKTRNELTVSTVGIMYLHIRIVLNLSARYELISTLKL